jgi:hypothetical protein
MTKAHTPNNTTMFTLIDSFNHTVISRHRTLLNAVKAKLSHIRAIERRYGPNSYVTYEITEHGKRVGIGDIHNAEQCIHNAEQYNPMGW